MPTSDNRLPTLTEVRDLVAAELACVVAPARRAKLEGHLVEPDLRSLTWDYGDEDQCFACWIIGR